MKKVWFVLAVFWVLCGFGCSGKPGGPNVQDAAGYAQDIKREVFEFVANAKKNPKQAGELAAVFLEKLEAHPTQPVGSHKPIYEELTKKCREIVEASKRSASSAEINRKLDEMAALANKLPGNVPAGP